MEKRSHVSLSDPVRLSPEFVLLWPYNRFEPSRSKADADLQGIQELKVGDAPNTLFHPKAFAPVAARAANISFDFDMRLLCQIVRSKVVGFSNI